MKKLTPIEELCAHLEIVNPDLFKSNEITKAEKAFYATFIKPAFNLDPKGGMLLEGTHTSVIVAHQNAYFVAGYLTAAGLHKDVEERGLLRLSEVAS
jgi:hypothetical protein